MGVFCFDLTGSVHSKINTEKLVQCYVSDQLRTNCRDGILRNIFFLCKFSSIMMNNFF